MIAEGRSLSEIVASNPTEGHQGDGERFVTAVFNGLTAAPWGPALVTAQMS